MSETVHPVDEVLPYPRLFTLGLQHVLVMYAGAVAVPLIIGRALKLPPEEIAFLITADLFCCGIATLISRSASRGRHPPAGDDGRHLRLGRRRWWRWRAIRARPARHLRCDHRRRRLRLLVAPFVSRMLPLFPPVVTGTIILVIGISLMRVGINWAGGGLPTLGQGGRRPDGAVSPIRPTARSTLGIALIVLLVILAITQFAKGFLANIAVLLGIVAGGAWRPSSA